MGWDRPTSSHLLLQTTIFMRWDRPTSSHLLPNPKFSWGWTVPPRPTFAQILSFYGVGLSTSHLLLRTTSFYGVGPSHLVTPAIKSLVFMGWGCPTLPHLLLTMQFFIGSDAPTSSHLLQKP